MLSIVSTPIGNLGDITVRAQQALMNCDAIVCEDTRVTGKLLNLLGFPKKELISFHSRSSKKKLGPILKRLTKGENMVLVSDAGTPGISDPGHALISKARDEGVEIQVIPGPSAFLAALSVSGVPVHEFVYLGFLPVKKGRKKALESIKGEKRSVVFYEAPHRLKKTVDELCKILGDQPTRFMVICRELTKMHEEVVGTTVGEVKKVLPEMKCKGEFCIVLGPM